MNNYNKTAILVTALLLATTVGLAQTTNPSQGGDSPSISIEPLEKQGLLDKAFSPLNFVAVKDKEVRPGEQITVPIEVTTTQFSGLSGDNYYFFVEIYNCQTSSCENQQFVESTKFDTATSYFNEGTELSTSVTYEVPQSLKGEFAVNSYLWNEDTNTVASTISVTQFTVVEPTSNDDSDGDGVLNSNDDCPDTFGERSDGCPIEGGDQDGDGTADVEDDCKTTFGTGSNGCPVDTDGDKVYDANDDCPSTAGTVKNRGCPESQTSVNFMNILLILGLAVLVTGGGYLAYGKQ